MSSFKKKISKTNLKFIVAFVLIALTAMASVVALAKIENKETTKTLGSGSLTYSIGLLDSEGAYEQGTTSIYSKDFESVDGLTIKVDENATITYSIFFFDADKKIDSIQSDLTSDFDSSEIPENAEYFKLMITPTNDAEVSFFEINTYAGQLTVTINK